MKYIPTLINIEQHLMVKLLLNFLVLKKLSYFLRLNTF